MVERVFGYSVRVLEVLGNAVKELVSRVDDEIGNSELHRSVVGLQQQIDQLTAAQAHLLAKWDSRKIWSSDSSKSAGHCLARETGSSVADAKRSVSRARRLSSMKLCSAAYLSGSISTSRIDLLVRTNQPALASQFSRDEEMLLGMAQDLSFDNATRVLRYWTQCADESRSESQAKRQTQARSASAVRTFEGTVDLKALFDPVSGEIFLTQLERIEDELFNSDWSRAKEVHGDSVTIDDLERSTTQRRCDALVEMAKRSASCPMGSSRAPKPLISVLVDYETFTGRVCELASGTIITPGQLVPLLSEADIERIVFDGPSRVIDVSQKREFTGALRRAIEVRDRHCQDPSGCDVPAERCQVDHIDAYVRSRATNQTNGRLLCALHNRAKGAGPP